MLESICMWFIVPLPCFRRWATFLFSIHIVWEEKIAWKKKKNSTAKPQTPWDTVRRPQCRTCNVDTNMHNQAVQMTHAKTQSRCVYYKHCVSVRCRDNSTLVFYFFCLCYPSSTDSLVSTHTWITHAHFVQSFFLFTSEAPLLVKSPAPHIYTEITTVAVVWDDTYLSIWIVFVGVCMWDQGCAGATCNNAPVRWWKCSSPRHRDICTHKHAHTNTHWPPVLSLSVL